MRRNRKRPIVEEQYRRERQTLNLLHHKKTINKTNKKQSPKNKASLTWKKKFKTPQSPPDGGKKKKKNIDWAPPHVFVNTFRGRTPAQARGY